jgi:hypothetical protein
MKPNVVSGVQGKQSALFWLEEELKSKRSDNKSLKRSLNVAHKANVCIHVFVNKETAPVV